MNTFKKVMIGAAVLAASAASFGATITTVVETPSPQAVATDAAHSSAPFVFTTQADYGTGDTISFTLSQDVDATQAWSTATLVGATCAVGNDEIGFAGYANNVATYIFGSVTGSTIGCAWTIPAIAFDGAAIAAADIVTVSAATSRGFGVLEAVAAAELINVGAAQFSLTVAGVSGEIDVEDDRQSWTGGSTRVPQSAIGGNNETFDGILVTLNDNGGGATLAATSTVTITGDMSWAKRTDADGVVDYPGIQISPIIGGPLVLGPVITDSSVTYVQAAAVTSAYLTTFDVTAAGLAADFSLPNETFTVSVTVNYEDTNVPPEAQSVTLSAAGGAWTLNGASITAYGISNSPSVTPMLWVQNGGLSNGNITATVFCDGNSIQVADLGTASPRANTKVGEAIQAAVDADGSCPTVNTRYDATITVNAPEDDITLNASYKVTAADGATDRVMLETSDSLPAASDAAN